jgi:hypothetical protein
MARHAGELETTAVESPRVARLWCSSDVRARGRSSDMMGAALREFALRPGA